MEACNLALIDRRRAEPAQVVRGNLQTLVELVTIAVMAPAGCTAFSPLVSSQKPALAVSTKPTHLQQQEFQTKATLSSSPPHSSSLSPFSSRHYSSMANVIFPKQSARQKVCSSPCRALYSWKASPWPQKKVQPRGGLRFDHSKYPPLSLNNSAQINFLQLPMLKTFIRRSN